MNVASIIYFIFKLKIIFDINYWKIKFQKKDFTVKNIEFVIYSIPTRSYLR